MAGAGYKLFNTGDVLTAAQVNTYLQEQAVMRFANAAARTTALASVLAEGMVSYLQDTDAVEVYNGTAWVGIGNSGDITGVTAGTGISGGGTSGTVTITNDMATTITAAGDIVVGTGSGTYDNLPIGTTGQVLTADTTVSPYKVKWASASSGGLVKIGTTSFSASSSVNVNDVFSSTYDYYQVVCNLVSTVSGDFLFRYRVSGSDNSTANYSLQGMDVSGTGSNIFRLTGQNQARLGVGTANEDTGFVVDMLNPYASLKKRNFSTSGRGSVATPELAFFASTFDATTSFTGFTLYVSSGTITGSLTVYGYAK